MTSQILERDSTLSEKESIQRMLANAPTGVGRFKRGAENALVLWSISLVGIVIVWTASAWLGRKMFDLEFGLRSSAAVWVLGIALPMCTVYAAFSSIKWVKGWTDYRPQLEADLKSGRIVEEHYAITDVKRFQEPEHGGLLYFLRTAEGKVFVLFDHESQELGIKEDNPLKSSFAPSSSLVLVRAPSTKFVLSQSFSGEVLQLVKPIPLEAAPEEWPESESFCSVPWSELEERYGPMKEGESNVCIDV